MPYMTTYTLSWRGEDLPEMDEISAKMAEIASPPLQELIPGSNAADTWARILGQGSEASWHDHHIQMARLSENWPHTIFELECRGENYDDLLREYYLNGRVQRVFGQVAYPEFDFMQLIKPEELD